MGDTLRQGLSFELFSISHPYGKELTGHLFYDEHGFMSAAFMNAERGHVPDGELSEAARASIYDQFMAYSCPFEVNGDKIHHFVEVSSLEVWTGTFQERRGPIRAVDPGIFGGR
ncbi:MAG: lipocalin-like domain-containing protein [bacterium]|nr:lipocalin-like domain-containing protein [bacterium]